jgi:hypothetical protein
MRFQSLVLLSLLAAGCGLLKSEPGSSGDNPPVMYGTGPAYPAGGAGGGNQFDAALPPPGGIDGGTILPADASADLEKLGSDTASHTDGMLWTRFPPSSYTFTKCTWLSSEEGYCSDAPSMLLGAPPVYVHLYMTLDGGKSWALVCTIDTEMPDLNATINVYVLSQTDFWFVAGSGNVGSVGHSLDSGKHWTSLTNDIASLLVPPGDGAVATLPFYQLAIQGSRIWILPQGANMVYSQNGGITWRKFTPPADFGASGKRSLLATQSYLLLQYLASDGSLGLYRWNNESAFLPVEAAVPTSYVGSSAATWSRAWPAKEGVFFADRGPLPAWGSPFAAYATVDGGASMVKILPAASGSLDVVGLSDGLAFSAQNSTTAYVSGIFSDSAGARYLEIRRTQDAGRTWTILHSEPSYTGDASYISLSMDLSGKIHAMHFVASNDGIGPPVIYDAHYVLQ